ncbi:MAG TPA: DUF4340 domain-containing protein [Steroidobacteraceae bacterium]|nr:DUF4340 domain-containing protein [Steroidobacteraceae bacterium]
MSGRRVAVLLIAAIAVVIGAIWLASQRRLERARLPGDLVLPGLEHHVSEVTQLSLAKGNGTRTTLKKDASGWNVAERSWPADAGKARKLLFDLGALNIVEEKTRVAANYPQLGVEDVSSPAATGTLIELETPGHTWKLIVGKSSSGKSGYVRVANSPQSFLAAPLLTVDADPKSWLDHALIDLSAQRVRQIEERPASGPAFTATRNKKEESAFAVGPLPKGRELTGPAAAEPIAAALSSLTLDDLAKASGAAAAGVSQATFRTFDGLEVQVSGHKDGERSLILISARSTDTATAGEAQKLSARLAGWEFSIPDYKYAVIFKPLEELLKKPPEPTKKPAKPVKPSPGKSTGP